MALTNSPFLSFDARGKFDASLTAQHSRSRTILRTTPDPEYVNTTARANWTQALTDLRAFYQFAMPRAYWAPSIPLWMSVHNLKSTPYATFVSLNHHVFPTYANWQTVSAMTSVGPTSIQFQAHKISNRMPASPNLLYRLFLGTDPYNLKRWPVLTYFGSAIRTNSKPYPAGTRFYATLSVRHTSSSTVWYPCTGMFTGVMV
jgi:hypothetical protein